MVQFVIFISMYYHLDFRQLGMYLLKSYVKLRSTGDRKASGLCCQYDGLGGVGTFETALKTSQQVKSDLISCGFTPNQKSVSNFREATIAITQKILKLKQDISFAVSFKII